MVWKSLIKYPVLIAGILLMTIFLFDLKKRGIFFSRADKLRATSCRSVLVMLDKRIPTTWSTECEKDNLAIEIKSSLDATKFKDKKLLKPALYRELANNLIFIAKNSLNESLERVDLVRVHLEGPTLSINAVATGRDLARFATMKRPDFIAEHLKATVHVKETAK